MKRFGRIRCALSGRHQWNTDIESIPETTVFKRVDCLRCGRAIDGAKLAKILPLLSPSMRRRLT